MNSLEVLHLTKKSNLLSIKKNGLIPSKVKNPIHLDKFSKLGLKGDKATYSWHNRDRNDKYAKDMIYCKQWIDKRNARYLGNSLFFDGFDFSKDKIQFFDEKYLLLLINVESKYVLDSTSFIHTQYATRNKCDPLFQMDSRFEHDDKQLCILKNTIDWKYITPIAEYVSNVDKFNKLQIEVANL